MNSTESISSRTLPKTLHYFLSNPCPREFLGKGGTWHRPGKGCGKVSKQPKPWRQTDRFWNPGYARLTDAIPELNLWRKVLYRLLVDRWREGYSRWIRPLRGAREAGTRLPKPRTKEMMSSQVRAKNRKKNFPQSLILNTRTQGQKMGIQRDIIFGYPFLHLGQGVINKQGPAFN